MNFLGKMRWYSTKPGERILQQLVREGLYQTWEEVPLVIERPKSKDEGHAKACEPSIEQTSQSREAP